MNKALEVIEARWLFDLPSEKFSRINQNFQVAKRRAMNVERNMRMHEADRLKAEAGDWTIAYNWLAFRLYLCEQTVRNAVYQIRRNTALYDVGGVVVCGTIAVAFVKFAIAAELARPSYIIEAGVIAILFIPIAYMVIMGRATRETLSVLQPREWNRFHLVDLHATIRDHVGEDKLQIVTFRDRNRME